METRIKLLVDSYGLVHLIEEAGYTEESILTYLVKEGMLSIEEYFEDDDDEGDDYA